MPYGKHKGKLIEYVARKDPQYIAWIVTNRQMDEYPEELRVMHKLLRNVGNANQKSSSQYTLRRMNVIAPRIRRYWLYDLAGFKLNPANDTEMQAFRDNRLYCFEVYGSSQLKYGVRIDDEWLGFVEGTEAAGLAYMRTRRSADT